MSFTSTATDDVRAERGPHPAASPFDKDVGRALGVTAFGFYEVVLPAGAQTVQHDHQGDRSQDAYAILAGDGVLVVDGQEVPVRPGQYFAVTPESTRHLRAGDHGLTLIAVCAT